MPSLNRVTIMGHLGKDPETRYIESGDAVTNFSVAASEKWKDKSGEWKEKTEWFNVVAWRKLGEFCGERLSKGDLVYVSGKLQTRDWKDKDGNKRYTTEVVANEVKPLTPKPLNQQDDDNPF